MAKKQKYYVVWNGHTPGIYDSWDSCLLQVKAYPNAKYKAFDNRTEAMQAYHSGLQYEKKEKKEKKDIKTENWKTSVHKPCVVVDAACSGNPDDLEYRGVDPFEERELFRIGPLKKGTNNIGEFLAIVHALALLKKYHQYEVPIYSDSRIAISWVKKKSPATKLEFDYRNKELQDLLIRAVKWLETHPYKNPILKWETEKWGENPADFGRK